MCRARRETEDLVRAGRDAKRRWYLGRGTGRGAWWCRDTSCGEQLRSDQLSRALRQAVSENEAIDLQIVWKASKSTKL